MENGLKEQLLEEIQRLGLNSYGAKVYLALLERNSSSVSEVAKISKVPRTRVYDVLNDLVTNGLATLKPGKYKKYSASDFDIFKERLIAKVDLESTERKKFIEKESGALKKKLNLIYPPEKRVSDPLDYIEIIKNPYQIHNKFIELYSQAEKEALSFTKPPFSHSTADQRAAQTQVQLDAGKRGVIQKCIIELPQEEQKKEYFDSIQNKDYGTLEDEIRVIEELPIKLFVFDEKVCFYTLEDPVKLRSSLTMIVTKHEGLAKTFKNLFLSYWEKANDYFIDNNQKHYFFKPKERPEIFKKIGNNVYKTKDKNDENED